MPTELGNPLVEVRSGISSGILSGMSSDVRLSGIVSGISSYLPFFPVYLLAPFSGGG